MSRVVASVVSCTTRSWSSPIEVVVDVLATEAGQSPDADRPEFAGGDEPMDRVPVHAEERGDLADGEEGCGVQLLAVGFAGVHAP